MRAFFLLLFLGVAPLLPAQTPGNPPQFRKTELFAGFSTWRGTPGRLMDANLNSVSLRGWAASATTYHFFRRWGLTTELSANFGSPHLRNSAYLFSGTYRAIELRRFALTGHILAGLTRWETSNGIPPSPGRFRDQNAFSFGFGQSVDIKLNQNLALRVNPSFRFTRFEEPGGGKKTLLSLPLSIGLVYKFGSR